MTPICNCASRTPTYPTFRETEHLPDCVWEQIRRLQLAVAELATQIDMADEPQESAEMRVERILNYGIVAYHQGPCQVQAPPAATTEGLESFPKLAQRLANGELDRIPPRIRGARRHQLPPDAVNGEVA